MYIYIYIVYSVELCTYDEGCCLAQIANLSAKPIAESADATMANPKP